MSCGLTLDQVDEMPIVQLTQLCHAKAAQSGRVFRWANGSANGPAEIDLEALKKRPINAESILND